MKKKILAMKTVKCRKWTADEIAYLETYFADTHNNDLAEHLGRTACSVCQMAVRIGLHKSKDYMARRYSLLSKMTTLIPHFFKKGHVPFNKGKKEWQYISEDGLRRAKKNRFKKGHKPANTHPIGYEYSDKRGNVYVKISNEESPRLKHIVEWEKANGRTVPDNMVVMFIDGDRKNFSPDNLMLVSRSEMMRLIYQKMSPEEKKKRLDKMVAGRNELIRKDKMRIRWGLEPKTKLVKKWYAR